MSENDDTDRVRFSQVLAGALAAVTAALLGSTMGVAGTVVGAGLASVISTVGGALYLRSIQRTKEGVRTVHAKVVGRSGGTTVLVSADDPEEPAEELTPGDEVEATPDDRPPEEPRRRRWPVLVVTGLAAFALGMAVVTGVEWLRGESLSGSGDTTVGSIVAPHRSSGGDSDPADPTTSTTTPAPPTTEQNPTTTTGPTTTSTTPPSDSSTTTTTEPPSSTTTTTDETPGESAVPPSN
jgi:hypothetical protein